MTICVCIKGVPDDEWKVAVSERGNLPVIREYQMNSFDEFALEEALRIAQQRGDGTQVVLICCGPPETEAVLRTALGMGGDKAVHIVDDPLFQLDAYRTACVLSEAVRAFSPDLVLMGKQATDLPSHQVAAMTANLLGLALTTDAVRIDAKDAVLEADRLIERGALQTVELPLPAVVSVTRGINEPRYPSFKNIMAAKRKEIERVPVSEYLNGYHPKATLEILSIQPFASGDCEFLDGDAPDIAAKLLDALKL